MKVGSLRVNGTLPRVKSSLYTITFEDDRWVAHAYCSPHHKYLLYRLSNPINILAKIAQDCSTVAEVYVQIQKPTVRIIYPPLFNS